MSVSGLPDGGNHWHRYAGHWAKVASPLVPHADDLHVYAGELEAQACTLLLGVTPQIAALNLRGVAVDCNRAMIQAHTPACERWTVVQADWRALPLASGGVRQVVGDGVLSMLRYPDDYLCVLQELRRVLGQNGKCVLRLFVAPALPESVEAIQADLMAGRIRSFHALKWRLMMSLCKAETHYNVLVTDVLALFNHLWTDRIALAKLVCWPVEVFDTVDVYQGSSVSLSFVPQAALDHLFRQFAARVRYCRGTYELAERCPVVVLEGLRK